MHDRRHYAPYCLDQGWLEVGRLHGLVDGAVVGLVVARLVVGRESGASLIYVVVFGRVGALQAQLGQLGLCCAVQEVVKRVKVSLAALLINNS